MSSPALPGGLHARVAAALPAAIAAALPVALVGAIAAALAAAACCRASSSSGGDTEPEPEPEPESACRMGRTSIDGLCLFEDVIDEGFQQRLVEFTEAQLIAGRQGQLLGKTFQAPSPKWANTGQSREMLQYGVYTNSNRVQLSVQVLPLPPLLLELRAALEKCGVFQRQEHHADGSEGGGEGEGLPDSCCVNVYSPGMWLPPHVDSTEFDRPFCTVSLLSDQPVVFGDGARLQHSPLSHPPTR